MDSLSVYNFPPKVIQGPSSLHELIRWNPTENDIAIEFLSAKRRLSSLAYASLDATSDRLAEIIKAKIGISAIHEEIIPVAIPQGPELYVSWIAVLKAGAAFCPVALDTPTQRLEFILRDVSAHLVLCLEGSEGLFRNSSVDVNILTVSISELQAVPVDCKVNGCPQTPGCKSGRNRLAYVMYTSGSTGQPKGVKIPHHSVCQAILAHDEHIPPFNRFLQFASPTFDVSVFETFFPLFRGATLISCEREQMLADLPLTIRTLNVDAAELTPTVAGTLLRAREAVPCLKVLLTIGEMLTRHVIEQFGGSEKQKSILIAMYGPTETSIHCTLAKFVATDSPVSAIGKPLATAAAFIIAEGCERASEVCILPRGQSGELAIGGQLALGYLNRPEQSAAAFIEIPEYGKVYLTGDRAKMSPDGNLDILGRISSGQVKIRGQRIELGEIETTICKTIGVHQAIMTIIDEIIVAFCIAGKKDIDSRDVMSTCKQWLPRHMRPGNIIMIYGDPPRLSSGKIDLKALDNQYRQIKASHHADNDLEDEIEISLSELLELEFGISVKPNTSLWSQGMDSLRAISLASNLREKYPHVTVSTILECNTISALAEVLRHSHNSSITSVGSADPATDISFVSAAYEKLRSGHDRDMIQCILPCSPMQIAMLAETVADSTLNFNQIKLEFSPQTSQSTLLDAFAVVAQQNEILRSGFLPMSRGNNPEMLFAQIVWKKLVLGQACDILHPISISFNEADTLRATVSIHHALYDGWSWDLIMADVSRVLQGVSLPKRPQFRTVVEMQRNRDPESETVHSYWQERLDRIVPTSFPILRSSKATSQHKSKITQILSSTVASLTNVSRKLHLSRQSITSAAWILLLSLYCGSSDITCGFVTSGRTLPVLKIPEIIGPCINTFPLRIKLFQVQTIQDLVFYVHRLQQDLLRFEGTSLRALKKLSGIGADEKLFDSLFVWQQGLADNMDQPLLVKTIDTTDNLDYSLVLELEPKDNSVLAKLTYESSKVPERHASLFLEQLDYLIDLFVRRPDASLMDLWQGSMDRILSSTTASRKKNIGPSNPTSKIEEVARRYPDGIAIEFVRDFSSQSGRSQAEKLTYSDLVRKAKDMSSMLNRSRTLSPDQIVCIIADKSIDLYVLLLAVMMAGTAYLCVDPRTPSNRICQILREAQCKVVISDNHLHLPENRNGLKFVLMSDLKLFDQPSPSSSEILHSSDSHLAYTVFTSGSTGVPKGVMITCRNLLSNIESLSKIYPHSRSDKLLQSCSTAFDVSVFEIFWTWHAGMTLCSTSSDVLFRDLERFIDVLGVTHLSMTPSVAALVNPDKVPKVKFLVTAGEPMNSKVFESWAGRGLYQGYGPSETTNICNVRPEVQRHDMPNNVGPALPNTSIFVCSRATEFDFRILPRGAIGEVWIGGEQVGRGYTDPILTEKSFIKHPEFGLLYRSGDIGRLLADNSLVILGREDDQVKVRGQRIELGDVNSALVRSELVADAVTLIFRTSDSQRILAFWTPSNERSDKTKNPALFRALQALLPTYMVPDALIPMQALPLTKQGKIDKKAMLAYFEALPTHVAKSYFQGGEMSGNETDLSDDEASIAQVIAKVTNSSLADVGRHSSFFALGLDSISCIRVAQELRDLGTGQVDISTILRHSTIDRLVKAIRQNLSTAAHAGDAPRNSSGAMFDKTFVRAIRRHYEELGFVVEDIIPTTSLQAAMLSAGDIAESNAYQNELRFRIVGSLKTLKLAWNTMISRHKTLRTGFMLTNSSNFPYAQVILDQIPIPWEVIRDGEFTLPHGFQTLQLPPYRLLALERENNDPMLILQMHHALYDAEAMSHLLAEVEASYSGQFLAETPQFSSYIDYMVNMDVEGSEKLWRNYLNGMKPVQMNETLTMQPSSRTILEQEVATITSNVGLQDLQKAAQASSTTILSWLQSVWARLLSCYFNSTDVCFGTVFSGRNLTINSLDRVVGPCFNTLPVRANLGGGRRSNQDLVKVLHRSNIEIIPYQPSSLRSIQRLHNAEGRPLFDTLLLLQNEPRQLDSSIWVLEREVGDMAFPVIMEIVPSQSTNSLKFTLHSETLSTTIKEIVLNNFDNLLSHSVQYPEARATDFSTIEENLPVLLKPTLHTQLPRGKREEPADLSSGWSDVELQIREIFSSLSGVGTDKISKTTSIFRLGLDSINAIQIAAKLRNLGFNIVGGDVLEAPSIHALKFLCNSRRGKSSSDPVFDLNSFEKLHRGPLCRRLDLDAQEVDSVRPCTATQSGILSQFARSGGNLYFNSRSFKLDSNCDISALKRAWSQSAERHEILRTGFAQLENKTHAFVMITWRPDTHPISWIDGKMERESTLSSGLQCLENLHLPPWQISISNSKDGRILKLSILHALFDAQALEQILTDVGALYRESDLPDALKIGPVIANMLAKATDQKSTKEFWESNAATMQRTKFPDLKVYHSASQKSLVATQRCSFSAGQIQEYCKILGVSLQVACLAAWAKVVAAYTSQTQVVFGVILSGRETEAESVHQTVFPCINTLPMSVEVSEDLPAMLHQVAAQNASLLKHQFTPLTSIKKWLMIEEDLFDTLFVLQKYNQARNADRPWTEIEDVTTSEYAVSIEVVPRPDNMIDFRLTVREEVMPLEQAQIVLSQFDTLLIEILSQSNEQVLSETFLSMVPAKHASLNSPVQFLHQFVEQTAKSLPEKIALEFATEIDGDRVTMSKWTYSELNCEGDRIAQLLVANGIMTGDLVGICFDKCPKASFAILGVLKAGAAYVAIDPGAPPTRREFILGDAACKVLLTTMEKAAQFEGSAGITVFSVDESTLLAKFPAEPPILAREISPDDICYCLYTSGTTGTPKGCLISHNSVVQAIMSFQDIFDGHWTRSSRWLQFASFHFDVSVLEQYWSWSVGICVTSAPRDLLFENLPGALRALKITHLDLTPSLAKLLDPKDVPDLCGGVFIVGGEQVSREILETWGDVGCLYNFYGPSEVTIGCTVHRRVPRNAKPSNIGQQWPNVGTFVLEPSSAKPVLRGAIGELCLSGPLVGKGYLNRKQLTEEKFCTLAEYETRVYRTGDLVRLLYDDSFEFLGRIDDQVKLRGQRLEIGEINHVIAGVAPEVVDVATMVLKHHQQQKEQLVSFFSTTKRDNRSKAAVLSAGQVAADLIGRMRERCESSLPSYMVPTLFIPISLMPLSANNKADTKALKSIFEESSLNALQLLSMQSQEDEEDGGSTNQETAKLIGVLAKFLDISTATISLSSRLFELGLDSISVIAFSSELRRAGFLQAHPAFIMGSSNVGRLSRILADKKQLEVREVVHKKAIQQISEFQQSHLNTIARALQVPATAIECIAPCTPLQEGMIFSSQKETAPVYYSMFSFVLDQVLTFDIPRLEAAWNAARQKLQILRTNFVMTAGGSAQVVLSSSYASSLPSVLKLEKVERNSASRSDHERLRESWQRTGQGFGSKPCWEVIVVRYENQPWVMELNIFHGLYDGISIPLILGMVASELRGIKTVSTYPYHDALSFGPLCKQPGAEAFWNGKLENITLLNLPSKDAGKPQSELARNDIWYYQVSRLHSVQQRLGVSMSAIFHASWLLVLGKHFGKVPTLGIVVSGRSVALPGDAMKVVGPMFNTVPWNVGGFSDGSSWLDLIKECGRFSEATMHQHDSLRDIARWTGQRSPLFDCLFVFQRSDDEDKMLSVPGLWRFLRGRTAAVAPLAVEIRQPLNSRPLTNPMMELENQMIKEEGISISIVAEARLIDEHDLVTFSQSFVNILDELVGDAETNSLPEAFHAKKRATCEVGSHDIVKDEEDSEFIWDISSKTLREQIALISGRGADLTSITEFSNIFRLGLDSIDVIRLSAGLRLKGLALSVRDIMRYPTIKQMAERIGRSETAFASGVKMAKVEHRLKEILSEEGHRIDDVESIVPATPMQDGILADFERYYNFMLLKLRPDTELLQLQVGLSKVLAHYQIFRTHFIEISDPEIEPGYAQVTTRSGRVNLDWSKTEVSWETAIESKLEAVRRKGLRASMVDLSIVRDSTGHKFVLLGLSHALYDAWSIELFHDAVAMAYANIDLPPPVTWKPHLAAIFNTSGEGERFWKECLAEAPASLLSYTTDSSVPLAKTKRSKISMQEVQRCVERAGTTVHSLGLACWALVLAHRLKQLDVCFGVVLSGRNTKDAERLMFPTFNTVIFRLDLQAQKQSTAEKLLHVVHQLSADISQYQHFPLRKALQIAGNSFEQGRSGPLFNSLFVYQKASSVMVGGRANFENFQKLYDVEDWTADGQNLKPAYPLNVEMKLAEGQLLWTGVCEGDVMDAAQLNQILEDADGVLRWLVEHSSTEEAIFTSDGGSIKICGLPAIALPIEVEMRDAQSLSLTDEEAGKSSSEESETHADHTNGNWSDMEVAIRDVLATAANLNSEEAIKKIGKKTSLFHLGHDSISAIKVAGMLKKRGIVLPVSKMMKALTIEMMATAATTSQHAPKLDASNSTKTVQTDVSRWGAEIAKYRIGERQLNVDDIEDILPATSGQLYMLGMWKASGGKLFYPEFDLTGLDVGIDKIRENWNTLQAKLPILRTTFMASEGVVWQVLLKDASLELFPRVLLVSVDEAGSMVKLKIHHALYDAVSLAGIMAELCGDSASLFDTDSANYVQLTQGGGRNSDKRKEFWTDYLTPVESRQRLSREQGSTQFPGLQRFETQLPLSEPRTECYQLDFLADVSKLQALAAKGGVSVPHLFMVAVANVHHEYLDQRAKEQRGYETKLEHPKPRPDPESVVIGVYLANRSLPLESSDNDNQRSSGQLAAPTFNIVPLRVRIRASRSKNNILETAAELRDDLERIGRREHCGVSLQDIYEWTEGRVVLDCVVNFLMDWGANEDERPDLQPPSRHSTTTPVATAASPFLGGDDGMDLRWCAPTVDVEARFEGRGLAVGVFAVDDEEGWGWSDEAREEEGGRGVPRRWMERLREFFEILID